MVNRVKENLIYLLIKVNSNIIMFVFFLKCFFDKKLVYIYWLCLNFFFNILIDCIVSKMIILKNKRVKSNRKYINVYWYINKFLIFIVVELLILILIIGKYN